MTTASEKLEATDSRREAGNKYFKEGDFARALRRLVMRFRCFC